MSKKRYLSTLKEMRQHFKSDSEALQSIDLLTERVNALEIAATEKKASLADQDFPLPAQLINDPQAFAIFADGACRGNPGPGAWGALGQLSNGDILFEASGVDVPTTNNRMELTGAIEAIQKIAEYLSSEGIDKRSAIHLFSDSKYLIDGINQWIDGWKRRGWKKADGKAPENIELWKRLDDLRYELTGLHFHWVKGHAGHPQNEQCDLLANKALDNSGF